MGGTGPTTTTSRRAASSATRPDVAPGARRAEGARPEPAEPALWHREAELEELTMPPTGNPGSRPESHIEELSGGTPRGGLRSLCSPGTLAGGLTELAWIGAHVLMYPLGTRTEQVR